MDGFLGRLYIVKDVLILLHQLQRYQYPSVMACGCMLTTGICWFWDGFFVGDLFAYSWGTASAYWQQSVADFAWFGDVCILPPTPRWYLSRVDEGVLIWGSLFQVYCLPSGWHMLIQRQQRCAEGVRLGTNWMLWHSASSMGWCLWYEHLKHATCE